MTAALDVTQTHIISEWAHDRPLISCRFEPQGRYVFAGAEDNSVQRWSLADGVKTALVGHESWVKAMAFSQDGETTITGGSEGRLIWWATSAEQPTEIRRVDAHQGWIRSMSVSPDGAILATVGNDLSVRLWNVGDGSLVREWPAHERFIYCVQFHPNGEFLITGDLVGVVKQWNVATGELVRTFDAKPLHTYEGGQQVDFGGVRTLAVSPDGKYLTAGGLHKATNPLGAVHEPLELLWEWESQTLVRSHIADGITGGVLWRSLYLSDQTLMGACGGSTGGFLLFWKPDNDKDFHRFAYPVLVRDMDLHADGIRAATAHHDHKLRIVSLAAKA